MKKMKGHLGHGYSIALQHYQTQKQNFLNLLKLDLTKEENQTLLELGEIITNPEESYKDKTLNEIIELIQNLINNNSDIKEISTHLTKEYQQTNQTKEEINKKINKELKNKFQENWFQEQIMTKLGNIETQLQDSALEDNAVRGRIRMLFNMAMRHGGILDPSKFTRSQLSGVLYEHALLEAIINFLNSKGSLSDIIEIIPIGAQGGRGDIEFRFHPEALNGTSQGSSEYTIYDVSIKNTDIDSLLTSQNHSAKLRVGGGQEVFGNELNKIYTVQDSIYFLSRGDNVKRAIGKNTTMYGFANGKIKFTSDLIQQLHYQKNYVLAMPNLKSYYISWIAQKNNLTK